MICLYSKFHLKKFNQGNFLICFETVKALSASMIMSCNNLYEILLYLQENSKEK